jgi:hypothetical protein
MVLNAVPEEMRTFAEIGTARQEYDEAASDYLALIFYHRARFAKGPPVIAWRRRRKHLEAALRGIDEDANLVFRLRVDSALEYVDGTIAGYEIEGGVHRGRKSPERDWLYSRLLDIWAKRFNGTLTTGRPEDKPRVANSPAIRFLLAALTPILDSDDMIGPEGAERIVEIEKARREQMPEMIKSWKAGLKAMKQRARRQRTR